jgi:pimeloyl-ACP methyl ester carboxylesterase
MGTVLLLHAGIADSRMWEPQVAPLEAAGRRVLTPDLRGFGRRPAATEPFSHARDAESLLDGPAAVVGCSLGGRVGLELALLRPDRVEKLVLIAPGLTGWEWSKATRAGWAEEEEAYERGDLEGAAEASVRMWVDGPRRTPEQVDPSVRQLARNMVLRSYILEQETVGGSADEEPALDPPLHLRLGEIACPTLVLVGDEDVDDLRAIAAHVAAEVPGAELVELPGAAHLPSLERPDEVNRLLLQFL